MSAKSKWKWSHNQPPVYWITYTLTTILLFLFSTKTALATYRHPISISCFSCASEEYEPLYSRSTNIHSFGQPMQFDKACDSQTDLENFSPTIRCDSSCITVLEPQFFGGILNEKKPYTFVRGCATDIFAVANAVANSAADAIGGGGGSGRGSRTEDPEDQAYAMAHAGAEYRGRLPPVEIDFLHRADTCLSLPIQALWPELFLDSGGTKNTEMVKVCACTTNVCNSHDALSSGSSSSFSSLSPLSSFLNANNQRVCSTLLLLQMSIIVFIGFNRRMFMCV